MHSLLLRFFPPRIAGLVLLLWYAALVFLVLLFGDAPTQAFRYGEL